MNLESMLIPAHANIDFLRSINWLLNSTSALLQVQFIAADEMNFENVHVVTNESIPVSTNINSNGK